ncbi:MAG: RluA family pseudouridine synthase [Oscillospiraceae bacterium]|nr:RluA family pseudouridine synthase [Oscillospiraceae bacterium]
MEIEILFLDPHIVVCLKPSGVASEEEGMPTLLRETQGGEFYCVHRLDKAVGGVMVYTRTKQAAAALSAAIAAGGMKKEYLAVVQGAPDERKGSMRDLLYHDAVRNKSYIVTRPRRGVKEALLDYELTETKEIEGRTISALRIALHTGRSHQIRVQLASRGMPLVGDGRYGSAIRGCPVALWSERLRFAHPVGGEELCFSAPPPESFPWDRFSLHNA